LSCDDGDTVDVAECGGEESFRYWDRDRDGQDDCVRGGKEVYA